MDGALSVFLSRAAERGFEWGEHDCMMFAADWARALTGDDPAEAYRGIYSTETEAAKIVLWSGGAKAFMADALEGIGWHEVCGDRRAGDIVLADLPRQGTAIAGVAIDARRVALLTHRGLVIGPASALGAWRHG